MATLNISEERLGTSTMQDEHGNPIIPSPPVPPMTEPADPFSSKTEDRKVEEAQIPERTHSTHAAAQPTSSANTNEHRESVEDAVPPLRTSVTDDINDHDTPFRPPKRVRTAPAVEGRGHSQRQQRARPTRTNTFLATMRQQRVGLPPIAGSKRDPFQYTFDTWDSSGDETSDSSDDEGGEAVGRETQEERKEDQKPIQEQPEATADTGGDDADPSKSGKKKKRVPTRFAIGNDFFRTKGKVSKKDGRLKIRISETANSSYVAKALGQTIRNHLNVPSSDKNRLDRADQKRKDAQDEEDEKFESQFETATNTLPRPRLNIVVMVIGSRGDIQPFLKIGKILQSEHGHRVRIATHPVFRDFVEKDAGLEFFDIGGDPSELMAFMVRNPGLIPNMQTLREGEIQKRRASMAEMFEGFWRSCIEPNDDKNAKKDLELLDDLEPFVADAIIANPPSMAHVHIAERLGIPLHIMFTFPYSPTTQFPHPLANLKVRKGSNVNTEYMNFMSYPLVEMMTWQGLGDIVNRFRENTLHLEPVSSLWAPGALYRMKVPYTYIWSPTLVPKPKDWGPEIDIAGFVFLNLGKSYECPQDLRDFLDAGEPPVYIGFGSIVVDDPNEFTEMIFKAVEMAGVRALVSKGWGGLGRDNANTPKNIFMLSNIPHDWLFPQVKAVVHHGGAGTTAIGLKCGRPTMIVPFFGDQPFWGAMVAEAKAGAHECIPYKKLTAEKLAKGIKQCLTEEAQINVQKIADRIALEGDGAENAVKSFHRSLPLAGRHSMRCSILQDRVAVWQVRKSSLRLCALAAEMLHDAGKIKWSNLKLVRHYKWNDFDGPGEPITGGVGALTDSLYGIGEGFGMVPVRIARHIREREEHERRKREKQKRKQQRERKKAEEAAAKANGGNSPTDQTNGRMPPTTRMETNDTMSSALSADPSEALHEEVVHDLNWGLKRAGVAILTMPNDLHVAIAQGFHNAPRLYGDATVRKPIRIKGVKSGFTAARKEFAYGIYDGFTGLVKQPMGDWQDGETFTAKLAGLGTGFGKGIGGFVLKNANALYAPPGFIVRGFIKHIEKQHEGLGSKPFIRKARIVQGEKDLRALQEKVEGTQSDELRRTQELVEHGFAIYEDIWNHAHEQYGPLGGNIVGKYKMKREKRRWDINGVFENVDTADSVLRAKKGQAEEDLEELFARRRKEMRLAEQPRAGVMETPETAAEKALAKPIVQSEEPISHEREADGTRDRNVSASSKGDLSASTAVATPQEEEKKEDEEVTDVVTPAEKRPVAESDFAPKRTVTVA